MTLHDESCSAYKGRPDLCDCGVRLRSALDPERVEAAKLRAEELLIDAAYFESRARAARAQCALLARTWGFSAGELLDKVEREA